MESTQNNCPMTSEQTLQRYFIENRSRLIDLAAYLDRIERSKNPELVEEDFRLVALREAIGVLLSFKSNRVEEVQRILSDLTVDPKESVGEHKSALGASVIKKMECC